MKIDIVERKPVRVVYLRYTGPFGESIGRFWRNTVSPWLADNGLVDCPRYGVAVDNPMCTPPNACRYDACVELPPGLSVADVPETTIHGGLYAITHFKGTGAQIGPAWGDLARALVGKPGSSLDNSRPPFEHYPRGAVYDSRTGIFACELCLPVRN
jgi:AraC family transcriptional regulator